MTLAGTTKDKDILFVQAFLLLKNKNVSVDTVQYIKTNRVPLPDELRKFWKDQQITIRIDQLISDGRFHKENDYYEVEENIFAWYRDLIHRDKDIYLFISGGHTAINIATYRAGHLFGARETFHMLIDSIRGNEPKSLKEVNEAIENRKIQYINLGTESGWPILSRLKLETNLSQSIRELSKNIYLRDIQDTNDLPFDSLSLLPKIALDWLRGTLNSDDYDFLKQLPKIELHCHLGGFATSGDVLNSVRNAADDSYSLGNLKDLQSLKGWPIPAMNIALDEYMKLGDNGGSYILKNTGCLIAHITLLYQHLCDQQIRYAEIRCSPFKYENGTHTGSDIMDMIIKTFNGLMDEANRTFNRWCHVNLIIIATRDTRSKDEMLKHLQLASQAESESTVPGRCKVVAVDLAGYENIDTRAGIFESDFESINRAGIALTIHAGENDEAEGIWQAVFKLNARRIGHGLNLYQDQALLRSIVNRQIGIEMCPYANYQIKGFYPMLGRPTYPLLDYLEAGAKVTINTDNIGISGASLTDNFLLLWKLCPQITRLQVLQLIRNSLDQAFVNNELRKRLLRMFNEDIFNVINNQIRLK